MAKKEQYKTKLLAFLGDPENPFLGRVAMATDILRVNPTTLYRHFPPHELQELESEALELRKKNSARQRGEILSALYREGLGGNVSASKEFLDRTEGPVKQKHEHTGAESGPIQVEHTAIDVRTILAGIGGSGSGEREDG